jgi:hypothetical protein
MKRVGTKPFPVRSKGGADLALLNTGFSRLPRGARTKLTLADSNRVAQRLLSHEAPKTGISRPRSETLPELVGPIAAMTALSNVPLVPARQKDRVSTGPFAWPADSS